MSQELYIVVYVVLLILLVVGFYNLFKDYFK